MHHRLALAALLSASIVYVQADGPSDNVADKVRPVPAPGIAIPEADRAELEKGTADLGAQIDSLRTSLKSKPALAELLPDVEIFHKAVGWALTYNEFYNARETRQARELLRFGRERAEQLLQGHPGWVTATGLVVRGYRSRVDGSVQPYGLIVPPAFIPDGAAHRLDLWFHGRGETLTELSFINGRLSSPGEFVPRDAFVLHLYGRFCNGSRFAGETDAFEALEHVRKHYPVDENRLVVRGFSLGGASCWDMATHYAGVWAAAAPGAGFSETADFLKVYQNEKLAPAWYEKKLWHMYDAVDYAANLFNCPTVAYSGEIDGQKQAADMMAAALAAEGMTMTHIIGPQTRHQYHPISKIEINRRIDQIAARGRNPAPDHVRFTTWTLRYNKMLWVQVDRLAKHWERARVDAEIDRAAQTVRATTANVTALSFVMNSGLCPLDATRPVQVILDGQAIEGGPIHILHGQAIPGAVDQPLGGSVSLEGSRIETDRSWTSHFIKKSDGRWARASDAFSINAIAKRGIAVASGPDWVGLEPAKRHGLQGPIDDAFMDSFVMVRPTGEPMNKAVGDWASAEFDHAVKHWRKQFRGDAPVVKDNEVDMQVWAANNLILWGDPKSNSLIARILDRLPIHWDDRQITVGAKTFDSSHHVPLMIFPNPLNPNRYVVLNSGFTFREYDYLNNARQTSKLPDYAVVDVAVPVSSRAPGGIVEAGFFGENWEITPQP
jgi:hypothetical protein